MSDVGVTRMSGATWCDVTRDGRVVAFTFDGDLLVEAFETPLAWRPADGPMLYLRADTSSDGTIAAVAQGQSGTAWLWVQGQVWSPIGMSQGQNAVEIVGDGTGWLVWVQRAPDRYSLITVASDGAVVSDVEHAMPWTSQGFLDASVPELTFTDRARVKGGVLLPNAAGTWLVGQSPDDPPHLLLAHLDGTPVRVLADALVFEPRATLLPDGTLVACSRSDAQGAVVVRGAPHEFPAWTPRPTETTPPPEETPPSEEIPMPVTVWTAAHQSVLEQWVAAFGLPSLDDEDARAWTRRVAEQFAWSFPDQGWGHKAGGGGRPPSTDVIATRVPFVGYDLIVNQGRPDQSVSWKPSPINLTGQEFIPVTPIDHLGTSTPAPSPPPVVTPTPPTVTCQALTEAQVREIVKTELRVLETVVPSVVAALREQVGRIEEELRLAAERREQLADLTAERLIARTGARTVTVSGRVSFTGTTTLKGVVE